MTRNETLSATPQEAPIESTSQWKALERGDSLMDYISMVVPGPEHWAGVRADGSPSCLRIQPNTCPRAVGDGTWVRLGETWRIWLQTHPFNLSHPLQGVQNLHCKSGFFGLRC